MGRRTGTGWQLTSILHRIGRVVRSASAVARTAGPGQGRGGPTSPASAAGPVPVDARARAAERTRQLLPVAERVRYDGIATAAVGADARAVVERTLAATGSVDAVEQMLSAWDALPVGARRAVLDPVRTLARAGRQSDGTTCGSSVLTMLAAAGDPTLALWLATGQVLAARRPTELEDAPPDRLDVLARGPVEARFAAVQRVLKHRTNRAAVLGLPWPAAFGTPPWGAARVARYADVAYEHRMLDDTDRKDLEGVLATVGRAVDHDVPVPLYSGGDSSRGMSAAMPRHVVLVIGRTADGFRVWEPAAGRVEEVATARLVAATGPVRALGGWTHLVWAILPRV